MTPGNVGVEPEVATATPLPAGFSALRFDGAGLKVLPLVAGADGTQNARRAVGLRRSTCESAMSRADTLVGSSRGISGVSSSTRRSLSISRDEKIPDIQEEYEASIDQGSPYDNIVHEEIEQFPAGTPRLAAFLSKADTLTMCRRFGRAHARILLHLQADIAAVIDKLDACDAHIARTRKLEFDSGQGNISESSDSMQRNLLEELKQKLNEYDDLLLKYNKVCALDRPPDHIYRQVFAWIFGNKSLDNGNVDFMDDFINHRSDMVYVVDHASQLDGFDRIVEWLCSRWPSSLSQRFLRIRKHKRKDEEKDESSENTTEVIFFSRNKILFLGKLIAVLLSVAILLIPVFMLSLVTMKKEIATTLVLIFVVAFAMLMSLTVGSKADAVFFSTCAYCAVLVTFLGNTF